MSIVMVGATATLTFEFARPDGTLYDPDAGSGLIIIREPGVPQGEGTEYPLEASGAVEQVSTGTYRLALDTVHAGRWHWRAEGADGARTDVGEGSFRVEWSRVLAEPAS